MKNTFNQAIHFLFLLIICSKSYSQVTKLEIGDSFRKLKLENVDYVSDDLNKKLAIIPQMGNKCKIHVVDSGFKVIFQTDFDIKEKTLYKGGLFLSDTLRIYFFSDTYKETLLTTYNLQLKEQKQDIITTPIDLYDENILDLFIQENKLLVFTLKNSKQGFGSYSYINGKRYSVNYYNFAGKVPGKTKALEGLDILGNNRPYFFKPYFDPEFIGALSKSVKVYVTNDSLHILKNTNGGKSEAYSICFKNSNCNYKEIFHVKADSESLEKKRKIEDNSFLLADKLFYVISYPDSLNLLISDFKSGKELAKFSVYPEKKIEFINTPLLKNGEGSKKRGLLNYAITHPLEQFRVLRLGRLLVYAEETPSGYEVMTGSLNVFTTGGYSSPMGSSTSLVTVNYGVPGINGSSGMRNIQNSGNIVTDHYEFISVFGKQDFKHKPEIQNPVTSLRQRKVEFADDEIRNPTKMIYIKHNGNEYLLHFKQSEKTYEVYNMNQPLKQ